MVFAGFQRFGLGTARRSEDAFRTLCNRTPLKGQHFSFPAISERQIWASESRRKASGSAALKFIDILNASSRKCSPLIVSNNSNYYLLSKIIFSKTLLVSRSAGSRWRTRPYGEFRLAGTQFSEVILKWFRLLSGHLRHCSHFAFRSSSAATCSAEFSVAAEIESRYGNSSLEIANSNSNWCRLN